jgi:O-antigen/teichoic acid export membrane protein
LQIGAYGLVSRLARLLTIPIQSVNGVIVPTIRKHFNQNELKKLKELSLHAVKLIFWLTFFPAIILVFFRKEIISLFDHQFEIATASLILLILGQVFNAITGPVGRILNMTDQHRSLMLITLFSTMVNIGLNLILIPLYALNGAAIATAFSILLNNLICSLVVKKQLGYLVIYNPLRKIHDSSVT